MGAKNLTRKIYRDTTQEEVFINKYLADSFIEDLKGRCSGIEYETSLNEKLRIVWISCSTFNVYKGIAEISYRQEVFVNGDWRLMEIIKTMIDDSEYYYSNPQNPKFGQLEPEPLDAEGNLKEDLATEVDFFSDNLLKNIHGLPIGMNSFIYSGIEALIYKITK